MVHADAKLPPSSVPGLVPTLNNTGWMTEGLDRVSRAFVADAGARAGGGVVLDIGCAYGVATLPALAAGTRVVACDMEPRHLEILASRVPEADRPRLECVTGTLPDVRFPPASFDAILCARVVHFLDGASIEASVAAMGNWLRPGGRLYLVADGPYVGPWRERAADYERKKAAGDPWPGLILDYRELLPPGVDRERHPSFLHPLDPDVLRRVATEAGLEVLESDWLPGSMPRSHAKTHVGLVAGKGPA